jgi:hypothetical protein
MIDWNKNMLSVVEEIDLYTEMTTKGYMENNPILMAKLQKDLLLCQFMANIKRKKRK